MNSKRLQLAAGFLICAMTLLTASTAKATAYVTNGSGGNWNVGATWTPTGIPGSADSVTINAADTVTVPSGYAAQCTTINFTTTSFSSLASINFADATSSLTASGAVTIQQQGTGGGINQINVGAGTFSAASVAMSATTSGTRLSQILISTGIVNISGTITSGGTSSRIIFSGAGTLNTGCASFMSGTAGTFTAFTGSTVNFNAAGAQSIAPFAYIFENVTLSGSGIKTLTNATINGILSMEGTATTPEPSHLMVLLPHCNTKEQVPRRQVLSFLRRGVDREVSSLPTPAPMPSPLAAPK